MIKQQRSAQPSLLLLDTGNFSAGHAVSDKYRGKPVAEVMNHLDFDAALLGHSDRNWGAERLHELADIAGFPLLAANWGGFPGVAHFDRNALRVAVIGLAPAEPPPGVEAIDPQIAFKVALEEIDSSQVVIVLSQLGFEFDRQLAIAHDTVHAILQGLSYAGFDQLTTVSETLLVPASPGAGSLGTLSLDLSGSLTIETQEKKSL